LNTAGKSRGRWGTTESVRDFWEAESCGERYGDGQRYEEIDRVRYELEPQIPAFATFGDEFSGLALEIGLGTGSDYERNQARGGAWIGVDLTGRALDHVRRRVGHSGRLVQADAQALPFRDGTFDFLYSWGVLLCCPKISAAIDEVWRVLKPGGEVRLMLYHSRSWVAMAAWLRWGWWRGLSPKVAVTYMESPGTQAFTVREAYQLLARFSEVSVRSSHTTWDERWLGPIGKLGGDHMGWFLLCTGRR